MAKEQSFELNGEFIELNKLLKVLQWTETGGAANVAITEGLVTVNGTVATEKRKKLRSGDQIVFQRQRVKIL
jgi:ribosome-associated protein